MNLTKPRGVDAVNSARSSALPSEGTLGDTAVSVRVNRRPRLRKENGADMQRLPVIPRDRYTDRDFNRLVIDHAVNHHTFSDVVRLWRKASAHGGAISIGGLLAKAGLGHSAFVSAAHLIGQGELLVRSPGRICLNTVVEPKKEKPGRSSKAASSAAHARRRAEARA